MKYLRTTLPQVIRLGPEYRDYVWGGNRLRPNLPITAEAWVIYEGNQILDGPYAGNTLATLTLELGADLIGQRAFQRAGGRFPLLIKLLDCAAWLSLQVHPDDDQARNMEGPDQFGKTEAWHILEANPQAQLIAGFKAGTLPELALAAISGAALGSDQILKLVQFLPVKGGDTILMRAGTIHALGPGLLVYEVQETSDLTYRVFDWNRPQVGGRILHTAQSLAVTNPLSQAQVQPVPAKNTERQVLTQCEYFTLERIEPMACLAMDTAGESFHALTVIEGKARVKAGKTDLELDQYESALVPAISQKYQLEGLPGSKILLARP